ncbi:MAG TPA: hypothetical protein VGJ20_32415 [Xanthobacteraceae bacterium]|jgi:hypothetical protein
MPALADAADGMATRAIPCEKSLAPVEGGSMRGSGSGSKEGKKDTEWQQPHEIFRVNAFSHQTTRILLLAESVGTVYDLD